MKKLLMLILIVLLVALGAFIAISGFEVANIEVLGYTGIQEKNEKLDETIQEASKLAEKDFKQAIRTIEDTSKKLEQTKKEYEDMTVISSDGDIQAAGQIEKYELETLWVKLGNYATSEGTVIRMDIVKGNTADTYNLKFTVNGSYISVTDFISDIENDSTLGFKIEEFKMVPAGNELKATFVCKEVAIKQVSETSNTNIETVDSENTNATNSTNTTNTTNTTSKNSNTTNTQSGNNTTNTATNNSVAR